MGCFKLGHIEQKTPLKIVHRRPENTRKNDGRLYYYGARYYAGWIGRFISVDPEKEKRSWVNPYNYVQNNPINRTDPTGALDDEPPNQTKNTIIEDVLHCIDIQVGYGVVHDNETGNITVYKTEAGWSKNKVSTTSNANIEVTRTIYDISAKGELTGINVNKRNINAEYRIENNIIIPDETFIKSINIDELENIHYQKDDKGYEHYKTDPIVEGIKAIKGNNILQDRDVFFDQSYSLPNLYFIDFAQGIYVSALKTIGSIFGYETHGIDYLPLDYDKDKSTYLKIPQNDVENAAKRLHELSKKSEY